MPDNAGTMHHKSAKIIAAIGGVALLVLLGFVLVAQNNKPATAPAVTSAEVHSQEPSGHTENTPAVVPEVKPPTTPEGSSKSPQFVVLAFDGSYSLSKWNQTLTFAREMKDQGKPIHFTYFLSGVYFIADQYKSTYQPPLKPAGTSLIGFGYNQEDVRKRVAYVNQAIADGHEIGSHLNGHFNGSTWVTADWQQEFDQFDKLIFSIPENNHVTVNPEDYKLNISKTDLIGFRAPNLGTDKDLWSVLKDHGYLYDTSLVGKADAWPVKLAGGAWEFPLASIKYADQNTSILSMDYNFYYKQSKAVDVAKKGSPEWQDFYNKTLTSYLNYFNGNYNGNHAPVYIGSHFSDWNDGVYWEAMKDFASQVCGQPEVRCVSFRELMNYLESEPSTLPQQ